MEVKVISANGFDKIANAVKEYNDTGSVISKSDGPIKYLDRLCLNLRINNLTTIQLFFLKKITKDFYITRTHINSRVHPEIKNGNHEDILKLYNSILNDDDFDDEIKNLAKNIIPIGSKKYNVIAKLTGKSLLMLTGVMIDDFIINEIGESINDYNKLCETLGILFKDKFIDYINSESNSINTLYEFMKKNYDYDYTDGLCTLATVETWGGCINLINNDSETLNNQIQTIKNSDFITNMYDYNVYTFIIDSSFSTFMDIYLCSDIIINYEDLNIVYNNKAFRIHDDILKKYHTRIENLNTGHLEIKDEIKKVRLPKEFCLFDYISYGTPIKYAIKIKESDIEKLFEVIDNNHESILIKNSMIKFINIINNTLK